MKLQSTGKKGQVAASKCTLLWDLQ